METPLMRAMKWMNEELKANPRANWADLASQASIRFNLSPKDGEFLVRRRFTTEES